MDNRKPADFARRIVQAAFGGGLVSTALILVLMMVVATIISPRFLTLGNIQNVVNRSAVYIVLGVGLTFVLTAQSIDISVGSIVGLTATVLASTIITWSWPVWLGISVTLATGALCGLFIGAVAVFLRVPAIIITLATLVTFRGLALVHLEGRVVSGFPDAVRWVSRGEILGFPISVWIGLVIVLGALFVMRRTVYGRRIYAIGGNPEAARRAGIKVGKYIIAVHVLCGIAASLAGIMLAARLNGVQATLGTLMEMHALSAVFIGGTSLFGGKGTMVGTLLGVLIVGSLENALVLGGVSAFWQEVALGLLLIAAVAFRTVQEKNA